MSAYTEQQELEKLHAWWKKYGSALIIGVLLGVGVLLGNKYWNEYKEKRLAAASDLYADVLQDVRKNDLKAVHAETDRLLKDYGSTPYAALGALVAAKADFDAGDKAGARRYLERALEHAADPASANAARLRLARLLASEGETKRALELLKVKNHAGYESEYQELEGDLLAGLGRTEEARAAYRAAIDALPANSAYRKILAMKLDNLGVQSQQ